MGGPSSAVGTMATEVIALLRVADEAVAADLDSVDAWCARAGLLIIGADHCDQTRSRRHHVVDLQMKSVIKLVP